MIYACRSGFAAVLLLACLAGSVGAQPNPYCISGANWASGGVMNILNMPGSATDPNGSQGYIWDELQTTNIANMVRPCKYWLMVGSPHKAHGYHEDTDTIDNPAIFQAWVVAHPGRIWMIGNEPNCAPQDGLTPDQYACMFHTYYTFIKPLDPTARFAIAGMAWLSVPAEIQAHISYFNATLASYRSQYGGPMPIDIWNCHPYTLTGRLSPYRILDDYIIPFHNYFNTVEGGIYAGAELWLTEFGVASWVNPLDPVYLNEFIQQACPVFEASGVIDRFFWFIGPWAGGWDQTLVGVSLVDANGQPTLIGQTFSSLARNYPNPIPPPTPSMQPYPSPPVPISSDFDATSAPWNVLGGTWGIDAGGYRQTQLWGRYGGNDVFLPYDFRDVRIEYDVKISATADNNMTYWAGVTLRGGSIWYEQELSHTWTYLVFLRQNGELGIFTGQDGTVKSATGVVADTSVYHHIQVDLLGSHIEVFVDGIKKLDWTDPNNRRSTGVVALRAYMADVTFDNVVVTELRPCDFDLDGDVDQDDFGYLQVCLSGPGVVQNDTTCADARLDGDTDVDWDDVRLFFRCRTAPGVPSNRDCLN